MLFIFINRILIARGANLLAVNADGNMPYDICEDEQALDYIESEMAKNGVTQQLIDETRGSTERKMLFDMTSLAQRGESLEQYDSQGATPVSPSKPPIKSAKNEFFLAISASHCCRERLHIGSGFSARARRADGC